MKRELIIIDGFNLIFRVFYAVPPFHTRDGKPVNALFGYTKALMQIMKMDAQYIIMTFDSGGGTFRSEADASYKAQRDGMPDDLASQMDGIFEVTDLLGIPRIAVPGYEADDIMGTLAVKHREDMERVLIVSSDKDLFQFIGGHVYVYDAMKDRLYDEEEAVKKFEVHPGQIVDYLALIGDTSDNIPGVKWIRRDSTDILYTPALIEFLKKYEFRSLLPADIVHTAPVYNLENTAKKTNGKILMELSEKIQQWTPYSLVVAGHPMMMELALALNEEEVYDIDLTDSQSTLLVRQILEKPWEMITYNWKENARKMLWWLEHQAMFANEEKIG